MEIVWVVSGFAHGEEGRFEEWIVAVYPDREQAVQHAEMAMKEVKGQKPNVPGIARLHNPFDPDCKSGRYGCYYQVEKAPFRLHVDEFLEKNGQ